MGINTLIRGLLKGKVLVIAIVGAAVVGGATAAAATPAGQHMVMTMMGKPTVTPTTHQPGHNGDTKTATPGADKHNNGCPGWPEAQQLATTFSLNTGDTSNSIKTMCALHQGTFKGTTSKGASVTSSKVLGYGEIDQLLTYANYLATHDTANTGGKLTDSNIQTYVANALQGCGSTPLMVCLKTNISGYQPGQNGGNNGSNNSGSNGNNKNDNSNNGKGKPAATPTPHH